MAMVNGAYCRACLAHLFCGQNPISTLIAVVTWPSPCRLQAQVTEVEAVRTWRSRSAHQTTATAKERTYSDGLREAGSR